MKISPFTPLCFEPYVGDGLPSRYIQLWAPTDHIMIQVCATGEEEAPSVMLNNGVTGSVLYELDWQSWQINASEVIYFTVLRGLTPGYYSVSVGDAVCDVFRVTTDEALLSRTSLIQYRFKDNKRRDDVVSIVDGMPYFFDFRVPGGFKESGVQFGVTNEQFATQHEDLVELFARDYIVKSFTLGGPEGVPVWYGALLNRLLTCSYVYIDGDRYTRNESEVPGMSTLVDGMDSFVFTQALRPVVAMERDMETVNQVSIRRVDGTNDRAVDNDNRLTD